MELSALTPELVSRAIYLDFEGFQEGDPVLVGWYVDGTVHQAVFDERLRLAAEAKQLPMDNLRDRVAAIVDQAQRESRMILGYSIHEKEVIERLMGQLPENLYGNLLRAAKRWRWRFHRREHDRVTKLRRRRRAAGRHVNATGNRLIDFCRLAGIEVPHDYAAGHTTARLSDVMGQLERRGLYESLTAVAKGKWTKLLKHNRFDCEGLAALARRMAGDAAQADGEP